MFITRKIGKVFRGKATPLQTFLASLLGGTLGFVPGFFLPGDLGGGFAQAPGLILSLFLLVLILNANLGIFGLATLVAKLVSFPLIPLSFAAGRFLLDGPPEPLFRALVNAPVFAYFGLEHYATSGGLLLGVLFGAGLGLLAVVGLGSFRRGMVRLEEGSEAWRKVSGRRSTRFLAWLLFGPRRHKKSWRELAEAPRSRNPIRVSGLILAVVVVGGLWAAQSWAGRPLLTRTLRGGLERANGATVDLDEAAVDLAAGRLRFHGLAMADPNAPERDLFRAQTLEADVSTADLLRRRLVLDRLVSREAATGVPRAVPGRRLGPPEGPAAEPPGEASGGEGRTLEDYLEDAEKWKRRLAQARDWLRRLAKGGEKEPQVARREVEEVGYVRAAALHLIEGAPTFLVRALDLEGVRVPELGGDLLDIRGRNLSTHPSLVRGAPQLGLASRSGRFKVELGLAAGADNPVEFIFRGLSADALAGSLRAPALKGGTVDVEARGTLTVASGGALRIDLPLRVTLHGTTLRLPGAPETQVEKLTIPIGVRGPLASPRVTLDDRALADALLAAGKAELARFVTDRADQLLKGKLPPGAGEAVGELIEGKKTPAELAEEARRKAEEELKRQAEELKKKLPGGLFGGKKEERK